MFPTYQQVPYVLRHAAVVANPSPLLRTGRLLHFVTDTNSYQSASVAAPAARVRQVPARAAQPISATACPEASGPLGLADSTLATVTAEKAATIPLIAKTLVDTNRDRVDKVMLNRIGVNSCDSGG
jgi:hypothetical protein